MASQHRATVREIIAENQYLTIATADSGRPWAAPVQFCVDDDLNFYFVSLPSSRHGQHIARNPVVALALFDSHQPSATGRGLQVDGRAAVFSEDENPFATIAGLDLPADLQEFLPGYVSYRVEPQHFYVPRAYLEGVMHDERLEVDMTTE